MERSLSQRALDALHEHMRKRGDRRARRRRNRDEKYQVVKRQYRYDYTQGPMCFLGQQIVKMMQDAGYPSKIHCCYRPPDVQQKVFDEKRSKARPWRSPHQFLEAVDIVHADLYWNAPQDYWDHLAACVKVIEQRFSVDLVHGYDWGWDSAHIELADWKTVRDAPFIRDANGERIPPLEDQLATRFAAVLPSVWKQYQARKQG